MLKFDPAVGWEALEERLERTESPRQRQVIQCVINHIKAEVARSLDGLMATLIPEPQYHFWHGGKDVGPKGYAAVRSYYEDFVLSGGAVFESIKERIGVDDNLITLENRYRNLLPGAVAKARGYTVPDESGHYLVGLRNIVFWPFDESGLAIGEDSYTQMNPDDWERIPDQELPQCYVDYLGEIGKLDVAR